MLTKTTIAEITLAVDYERRNHKKIVFIPTMGALHDGHLALVETAQNLGDIIIVSIFVNKTQFNDPNDFKNYPRQIENDLARLRNLKVDYVFLPSDEELFEEEISNTITVKNLSDCLCGSTRPGHFDGVALIITKMFNIVKPHVAIFGEKDFQQLAIIKKLVHDFNFDVEIFSQETVRETSGLAMSSRNQRLSESGIIKAARLFATLQEIKNELHQSPQHLLEILAKKQQKLLESGFEKIDYLEVRTAQDLKLVTIFDQKTPCRLFVAAFIEGVRLIDNIEL